MESPSTVRIRVDAQGRMVLPQLLRREIATTPGEVLARRTPDGILLVSATADGVLDVADDGLPVLRVGKIVTNREVLEALDEERAER